MAYQIIVNLIPGLPREAYQQGIKGVVGHATANNGDSADGERSYESRTFNNAFVHFFVDNLKIEQVADTRYLCYGAGHTANHLGYVQVELCQTTDTAKFLEAYARYVWLLAKILFDNHLPVIDGDTLMSHAQVSTKWHETDHTDPIGYLSSHGKTWSNVVSDVTREYSAMKAPVSQPKPVPAPTPSQPLYRVRKSSNDTASQIGAYHVLESAKTAANAHPGYSVYDQDGKLIYVPPVAPALQPTPVTQPTPAPQPEAAKRFVGTAIMGKPVATANQCNQFIRSKNPNAPLLADIYYQMGEIYGVRPDIAFAQMCEETKDQLFGGDVKSEQHNPAGLGAVGDGAVGADFADWNQGIEAQFQHLFSYASNEALPNRPIVDPRNKYIHRGECPWVEWLGIPDNPNRVGWASDAGYGLKILDVLAQILKMSDMAIDPQPKAANPVDPPAAQPQPEGTQQPEHLAPVIAPVKPVITKKPASQEPTTPVKPENVSWFSLFLQFLINFFRGGKQ